MDDFNNCGMDCKNCPIPKVSSWDKDWKAACKRTHEYRLTHEVKTITIVDPITGDTVLHNYVTERV